jgi:hypothetical protein
MPLTRRYKNGAIVVDRLFEWHVLFIVAHQNQSLPLFDAKELIDVGVHLQTNVLPGRNRHERQLQMASRP